jgi:inner membrane protein
MDPLTHGLIGAAISTFSGTPAAFDNPVTIGAMIGAMSPDLDFVIRLVKDDAKYLEHHRGASHSMPYLLGFSVAITSILSFMTFKDFNFLQVLFWTFIGALSHTGMDILNSYGAKLFKRKLKASLLTLYDPVFTLVGLYLIIVRQHSFKDYGLSILIIGVYLMSRWMIKNVSKKKINTYFTKIHNEVDVHIIPSLKAFYKWDYVVHTDTHDYVGQFNPICLLRKTCSLKNTLQTFEKIDPVYESIIMNSTIGRQFSKFSPNLHIKILEEGTHTVLRIVDLRYFFKKEFMHQATVVIDPEYNILSSLMHPYTLKNAIPIH